MKPIFALRFPDSYSADMAARVRASVAEQIGDDVRVVGIPEDCSLEHVYVPESASTTSAPATTDKLVVTLEADTEAFEARLDALAKRVDEMVAVAVRRMPSAIRDAHVRQL